MSHSDMYSMKNFGFLARNPTGTYAQGQPAGLQAIIGSMNEEHRERFCQRYKLYCRQVNNPVGAAH